MDLGTFWERLRRRHRERHFEIELGGAPPSQTVDEWVVGRGHCHYFCCQLPEGLGPAKRRVVVRLQALQASPYERTGMILHFDGQQAAAIMWDEQRVNDAISAAGIDASEIRVIPETALREPGEEGLRLVACTEGCEGQVWRNGWLATTRWWPNPPSSIDWQRFQRGAGPDLESVVEKVPVPAEVSIMEQPWTRSGLLVTVNFGALPTQRLGLMAAVVPFVILMYGLGHLVLYQIESSRLRAGAEELQATSLETLEARRVAIQNRMAIMSLIALDPYPDQLSLMATVSSVLGRRNIQVEAWNFRNGNLEITLVGQTRLDATFYVTAFEKSEMFRDVAAQSTPNATSLKLTLKVNEITG